MKKILFVLIMTGFSLAAFGQSASGTSRYDKLKTQIDNQVTTEQKRLDSLADSILDNKHGKQYRDFFNKYTSLTDSANIAYQNLDFLIRANAELGEVTAAKNRYDDIIARLETLQSDYNQWLQDNDL